MDLLSCHRCLRSFNHWLLNAFDFICWSVEFYLVSEAVELVLNLPFRCIDIYLSVD